MKLSIYAKDEYGLSEEEIRTGLIKSLEGRTLRRVLILPPDFTRYHSNCGLITAIYYRLLTEMGCEVDVMPAIGTHVPMTREQAETMFPGVPYEKLLVHRWREDVVKIGEVPADYLSGISEGLWKEPIRAEINRRVMDERYDLILSAGQVIPHCVAGMANHAKNLFVGVGGSEMINKSHMLGAVYGIERVLGRDHTPVRQLFDYSFEHFLKDRPILFVMTVCTAPGGKIRTHGLFIGEERDAYDDAVALSQKVNLIFMDRSIRKCVAYLDPKEFISTWVGNKAIYRTRMAMEDGGELLILAPGIREFGEDPENDRLIRKYGYVGRQKILTQFEDPKNADLRENMGAAAHLIHGSVDGRFHVTYAVRDVTEEEIASVGFTPMRYEDAAGRYDPEKLKPGFQTMPDGEEIFFIPNPTLGLWVDRSRF